MNIKTIQPLHCRSINVTTEYRKQYGERIPKKKKKTIKQSQKAVAEEGDITQSTKVKKTSKKRKPEVAEEVTETRSRDRKRGKPKKTDTVQSSTRRRTTRSQGK